MKTKKTTNKKTQGEAAIKNTEKTYGQVAAEMAIADLKNGYEKEIGCTIFRAYFWHRYHRAGHSGAHDLWRSNLDTNRNHRHVGRGLRGHHHWISFRILWRSTRQHPDALYRSSVGNSTTFLALGDGKVLCRKDTRCSIPWADF